MLLLEWFQISNGTQISSSSSSFCKRSMMAVVGSSIHTSSSLSCCFLVWIYIIFLCFVAANYREARWIKHYHHQHHHHETFSESDARWVNSKLLYSCRKRSSCYNFSLSLGVRGNGKPVCKGTANSVEDTREKRLSHSSNLLFQWEELCYSVLIKPSIALDYNIILFFFVYMLCFLYSVWVCVHVSDIQFKKWSRARILLVCKYFFISSWLSYTVLVSYNVCL